MLCFPNAKINLGLRVLRKRPDGYHDLESVMLPVGWADILEIVPSENPAQGHTLRVSGSALGSCPMEKNLVMKALRAVEARCGALPPVEIYLRKIIPDGAGLGGGSSDAAFTIMMLNSLFSLGLTAEEMAAIAARVGADVPFFIYNRPMLATGTGTSLSPFTPCFDGIGAIAIAKPCSGSVSTAAAYAGVTPSERADALCILLGSGWTADGGRRVENDFENSVFPLLPESKALKEHFAASKGCVYASMSGSGSAVYGLFGDVKMAEDSIRNLSDCLTFVSPMPCIPAGVNE